MLQSLKTSLISVKFFQSSNTTVFKWNCKDRGYLPGTIKTSIFTYSLFQLPLIEQFLSVKFIARKLAYCYQNI